MVIPAPTNPSSRRRWRRDAASTKPPVKKSNEADAAAGGVERSIDYSQTIKTPEEQERDRIRAEKRAKREEQLQQLTKRARFRLPNHKNVWPQHPKITDPAQRARAYIRVAGLLETDRSRLQHVDPELDLHSPQVKFGRLLGGTDARVRHHAVMQLQAYLKAKCQQGQGGGLSELDLLKLWKALWHTLYMADKVPVQEELSKQLAQLIWCLAGTEEEDESAARAYLDTFSAPPATGQEDDDDSEAEEMEELLRDMGGLSDDEDDMEEDETEQKQQSEEEDLSLIPHKRGAHLASLFLRAFLRTVLQNWSRMDKYRVDKFYTLMRLMMHQVYKYMALRHWNLGILRLFNDVMSEEVLGQTPSGVRFHLIDICLEELVQVQSAENMPPLTEATFIDCMEPYFVLAQHGGSQRDDTVQQRVMEMILYKFVDEYSVVRLGVEDEKQEEKKDENEEEKPLVLDQVHVRTVAETIFHMAASDLTRDRYRKSLYDFHKHCMRRLKAVGKDVETATVGGAEEEEEAYEGQCYDEEQLRKLSDGRDGEAEQDGGASEEEEVDAEQASARKDKDIGEEIPAKAGKKKKKKGRGMQADHQDEETNKPAEPEVKDAEDSAKGAETQSADATAPDKKKRKKKKKGKKKQDAAESDEYTDSAAAADVDELPASKTSRDRKPPPVNDVAAGTLAKQVVNQQTTDEDTETSTTEADGNRKKSQKKKRKKKDQAATESVKAAGAKEAVVDDEPKPDDEQEEEEITISVRDQKAAKAAMSKKKKKKQQESDTSTPPTKIGQKRKKAALKEEKEDDDSSYDGDNDQTPASPGKRVKFGKHNKSRSWKLSMKNLLTMDSPVEMHKSPEKGILLNKGAPIVKAKKGGRKRAQDYF